MIKAIETVYKGYRFRSRLEARWAVFFDTLGVKWEYEKEGYDLGRAGRYLPDFWLPEINGGCWVEIKGVRPTVEEAGKAQGLARLTGHDAFIFFGPCTFEEQSGKDDRGSGWKFFSEYGWDSHHVWCECPKCGRLGIQYSGEWDRLGCGCPSKEKDYNPTPDAKRIVAAYNAACAARFERDEGPTEGIGTSGFRSMRQVLDEIYEKWEALGKEGT